MIQAKDTPAPAGNTLTMNSITGKLVLSMVRGNDYAHPGEEEAIDLVLDPLPRAQNSHWLDAGCGIGGTARYVERKGWAKVTGIDVDPANIAAASERHPGMSFICSDVARIEQALTIRFDVIYSFNAFFLFEDQPAALKAMRAVARPSGTLAIFDYVDLGGYLEWQKHRKTQGFRRALRLETIEDMLSISGWALDRIIPVHTEYLRWYEDLVSRIASKRETIVSHSSVEFYEFVLTRYTETLDDVRAGRLGGATIYATAS